MTAFDRSWSVLKHKFPRDKFTERDAAYKNRLVNPDDAYSEFKDKPGGGHRDENNRLINPFYRVDKPFEREEANTRELPHHWESSKFSNIMDLSDYPTPESGRAKKQLEDILSGKLQKVEKVNKKTGLKEATWKTKKGTPSDIHKHGLKHDNPEMLGRQALEHLQSLGLEASRHQGHLFIKMSGKGNPMSYKGNEHHFYIPLLSHNHDKKESWPDTILTTPTQKRSDKGVSLPPEKRWNIDRESRDPHTMYENRMQPPTKPFMGRGKGNRFIDHLNTINPYHKNSILSKDGKLEATNPEKAAKKRFEKQYWERRDSEQKQYQDEDMGGPADEEGFTHNDIGITGGTHNPDVTMTDMHPRLAGLIENELHAMSHWWEDPKLKAKDIKQKMPFYWHFMNLKWGPKHEQLPKKWWQNRAKDIVRLNQHFREGPPHPSMQEPGTFDGGMSDTTSSLLERNKFRQQHGVTTDDGKLVPPLLPTGRAIDQDRGEVQPAGPGAIQPPTQKRGGLGLAALDAAKQPSDPSPWIPPPNKRMPLEDVLEANKDVDPTIRRAYISPLEDAFDVIIKKVIN